MTNGSDHGEPAAVPLFTYTVDKTARSLSLDEKPKWRFPCGLCNAGIVTEPGALCEQCSPAVNPPKPRKRASKKTRAKKTTSKTGARKRGES